MAASDDKDNSQGGVLQIEDMESILKHVTFDTKHIKQWVWPPPRSELSERDKATYDLWYKCLFNLDVDYKSAIKPFVHVLARVLTRDANYLEYLLGEEVE